MNSNYGKIKDENLFFEEPSLEMPTAGRLLSRLISYSAYAVATAGAITLLMSDVKWLFWTAFSTPISLGGNFTA
jgi:hypothetical protein